MCKEESVVLVRGGCVSPYLPEYTCQRGKLIGSLAKDSGHVACSSRLHWLNFDRLLRNQVMVAKYKGTFRLGNDYNPISFLFFFLLWSQLGDFCFPKA